MTRLPGCLPPETFWWFVQSLFCIPNNPAFPLLSGVDYSGLSRNTLLLYSLFFSSLFFWHGLDLNSSSLRRGLKSLYLSLGGEKKKKKMNATLTRGMHAFPS